MQQPRILFEEWYKISIDFCESSALILIIIFIRLLTPKQSIFNEFSKFTIYILINLDSILSIFLLI